MVAVGRNEDDAMQGRVIEAAGNCCFEWSVSVGLKNKMENVHRQDRIFANGLEHLQ